MKNMFLAMAIATTATSAMAQSPDDAALQSAKIGAAQAIQAAENQSGGKAASADFETPDGGGAPFYLVEVIGADGKEQHLAVDAATGTVSPAQSDDENGNEDSEDGGSEDGEDGNN